MGDKPVRPSVERAKMADYEAKHAGTARGERDAPTEELLQPFVTREDMRMPRRERGATPKPSTSIKAKDNKSSSKRPPNHGEF